MNSNPHRRAVAFHEAGHCLLAWMHATPGSVRAAILSANAGSGGFTWWNLSSVAPWQRYAVSIAGPLATAVFAAQQGLSIESAAPEGDMAAALLGLRGDMEDAGAQMGGASEPVYTPEALASIEAGRPRSIEARTLRLLRQHWPAVEDVAQALETHGRIGARQLTRIMRRHGVERARA